MQVEIIALRHQLTVLQRNDAISRDRRAKSRVRAREVLRMSAIAATICSPGRNGTGMPKLEAWNSTAAARNVIAADLRPIGTGVVLPQLAGIA